MDSWLWPPGHSHKNCDFTGSCMQLYFFLLLKKSNFYCTQRMVCSGTGHSIINIIVENLAAAVGFVGLLKSLFHFPSVILFWSIFNTLAESLCLSLSDLHLIKARGPFLSSSHTHSLSCSCSPHTHIHL